MNITKSILKNKNIEIIADDNTLINNDKLRELVANNTATLKMLGVTKKSNVAIILHNSILGMSFLWAWLSAFVFCGPVF